ncbi:MAG TPA: hypothetical protein GXX36_01155 [Clostridiaceae bacterium]|nr:hypothetical protein [Clostridiaceae bacterium]
MILAQMYYKLKLLTYFKNELTSKGYTLKTIAWIDGQLDLLRNLIDQESFTVLNQLLRKTNYRLLKQIDKGKENLIDIYLNPNDWKLGKIEDNPNEWTNKEALIFSTERQKLVFSKSINGQKYLDNKWQ